MKGFRIWDAGGARSRHNTKGHLRRALRGAGRYHSDLRLNECERMNHFVAMGQCDNNEEDLQRFNYSRLKLCWSARAIPICPILVVPESPGMADTRPHDADILSKRDKWKGASFILSSPPPSFSPNTRFPSTRIAIRHRLHIASLAAAFSQFHPPFTSNIQRGLAAHIIQPSTLSSSCCSSQALACLRVSSSGIIRSFQANILRNVCLIPQAGHRPYQGPLLAPSLTVGTRDIAIRVPILTETHLADILYNPRNVTLCLSHHARPTRSTSFLIRTCIEGFKEIATNDYTRRVNL
ncbi:hypothetical protein AB1N83_003451 [Pleurotus pulmonarius]